MKNSVSEKWSIGKEVIRKLCMPMSLSDIRPSEKKSRRREIDPCLHFAFVESEVIPWNFVDVVDGVVKSFVELVKLNRVRCSDVLKVRSRID